MTTIPPTRVIALLDAPPNVFSGTWPDRVLETVSRPELHVYETPAPKGRVLVCPGGGYVKIMHDREGVDVALWLNQIGYDAYVLVYRLPGASSGQGAWPKDIALVDAMAALAHVEGELPFFVIGLSSGGHLAGAVTCQPEVEAAGLVVAYAPINANHARYKVPAGKPDYPPREKQAFYDDWPIGVADQPHGLPRCPTFLAYALHDNPVPIEHALNFISAARDVGLDLDAHVFGTAPHGFALRDLDGSHGVWTDLARRWMTLKAERA